MGRQATFADPATLIDRVEELIAAMRPGAAAPILAALRQMAPGPPHTAFSVAAPARDVADDGCVPERAAELMAQAQFAAAAALLTEFVRTRNADAQDWDSLGQALLRSGEAAEAGLAFAAASDRAPRTLTYALHRLEAAWAAGQARQELERLDRSLDADPLDVASLAGRGILLDRLGRPAEARDSLEAATALAPDEALLLKLHGTVLSRQYRPDEALPVLRRSLAIDPTDRDCRNELAVCLIRLARHAEACVELERAIADHGADATLLNNLALATSLRGEQARSRRLARQAVAAAPDAVSSWRTLCNTLPYCEDADGAGLLAAMRACADRLPRPSLGPFANDADPARRLRVGLLSGSLRCHPVGWLTFAGFEALDPEQIQLICLNQAPSEDAIAHRFRAIAAEWHEVAALDDAALGSMARARRLDLLIDLGGYGDLGRMTACAARLAPVQIKWVGMQYASSGLPEMDWFITDRWETPEGSEPLYSERLLRLPDGYVCYSPPPYAPEVAPLPARAAGHVTFGCFNNLAKITPQVIATWADILRRLPEARLVLKAQQFSEPGNAARVAAAFAEHGIAAGRVELQGRSPHRAFLAEYNRIDIVLDPFPYSGGLTTCEALWMGVPVITLPGDFFASRHSVSHLSNVGLADWAARSREEYIAQAVSRARDIEALAALRAGLRARVGASPLCDGARFGAHLGAALRRSWNAWCASQCNDAAQAMTSSPAAAGGPMLGAASAWASAPATVASPSWR